MSVGAKAQVNVNQGGVPNNQNKVQSNGERRQQTGA